MSIPVKCWLWILSKSQKLKHKQQECRGCSTPPSTNMQIQKVPTIFSLRKSADNPLSGWSSTPLLPTHCKVQNAECKVHFSQCKVQSAKCRVLHPKYLTLPVLQQCSSEHHCSFAPIVRSLTVQRASAKSLTVQRAKRDWCRGNALPLTSDYHPPC